MKHLYGNIIASVDVETTGLVPGKNEIIQIAVVLLDNLLLPTNNVFYTNIRPNHPDRLDPHSLAINGLGLDTLLEAPSQFRALDLFLEWIESLHLPLGRKLIPLAHNYLFEHGFLSAWMGPKCFDSVFHYHPRDAMMCALAMKDQLGLAGKQAPFKGVGLAELCKVYGITNDKEHDALADAIAEAHLYRTLLGATNG
jgi:DNA polymerase-3 subunit epsilon